MTNQEINLQRIASWDRYQEASKSLFALKSKLEGWRKPLAALAEKLEHHPLHIHESDFIGIPTRDEFTRTVVEQREAITEYERARESARNNGFPVDTELNRASGC